MSARSPLWLALFVLTGCGGAAGNCSVVQNDDGSATVECPDGTSATLTGGEAGTDGIAGTDGTNGTDGTDGAAGTAALIRIDEEAPGESCAKGGVAIHAGLDDDADGALSDLEIDSTAYLCNGTDGTDGIDGANGSDGGDGSDGSAALIRIEALAAGDECSEGGVVIYAGADTDGDAYLDEAEVTETAYLCGAELAEPAVVTGTVEFPSASSSVPRGSLGGLGTFYIAGDYVTQTFTGTGLSSVTELDLAFDMHDGTGSSCSVGIMSWDVSVNDTTVGSYSFEGGLSLGVVPIEQLYTFPAIAGTGVDGDTYELTIAATTTVCGGGGSWNWYTGGTAILGG
jgi:hypothetical protein